MKLQEFTDLLSKFNIKFEVNKLDTRTAEVGVNYGKSNWHWFEVTTFKLSDTTMIYCAHSYSQNTGKTERGIRWRMNIEANLCKKLQIESLNN